MPLEAYSSNSVIHNGLPRSQVEIHCQPINKLSKSQRSFSKSDPQKKFSKKEHALIGVSPFNGYFSAINMEILFKWANENFDNFSIFTMDKASKYNLMAMGYEEEQAIKKTKKQDQHLYNKVVRCLINIGFGEEESRKKILLISHLKENERYLKLYKECLGLFENNASFRLDCLNASKCIFANKVEVVTEESTRIAVNYLLEELPIWLNTPYILGIRTSVFVYKDLPPYWYNICYNYGLIAPKQKIFIKSLENK